LELPGANTVKPRSIAIVNRKGGVWKTTSVVNVSHGLALRGKRVLVVDLDSQQSSLTTWIGGQDAPDGPEIADLLLGQATPAEAIIPSTIPNVDLVRSSVSIVDAEEKLKTRPGRDLVLARMLETLPAVYDYIIFDCPPSLSPIVVAALVAVDEVIIPLRAQGMSLEAIDETLRLVDEIVEYKLRPARPAIRALVTEYDGRLRQARAVLDEVRKLDGVQVFETPARRNEAGSEAFNHRQSIFDYDARAIVADDYAAIADALIAGEAHG
jgi:chromosome partitioning protein